jgi:hypothetical protein
MINYKLRQSKFRNWLGWGESFPGLYSESYFETAEVSRKNRKLEKKERHKVANVGQLQTLPSQGTAGLALSGGIS